MLLCDPTAPSCGDEEQSHMWTELVTLLRMEAGLPLALWALWTPMVASRTVQQEPICQEKITESPANLVLKAEYLLQTNKIWPCLYSEFNKKAVLLNPNKFSWQQQCKSLAGGSEISIFIPPPLLWRNARTELSILGKEAVKLVTRFLFSPAPYTCFRWKWTARATLKLI